MEGVVIAIIIGALIIAGAIRSSKEDNEPEYYDPYDSAYKEKTDDEIRKEIIESGLDNGQLPIEIAENLWFKTEENVLTYAKQYGLENKVDEIINKRRKNPNLPKEIERDMLIQEIRETEKSIKDEEEDFELAKTTNNYEEAKNSKDMLKFHREDLKNKNKELEELNKILS